MKHLARTPHLWGVAVALLLSTSGCLSKMILNGQIQATRQGSASFDTLGDYELAQSAAASGLAQFEGMHLLAPENTDALFMLTKGWGGYGIAFAEEDYEDAIAAKNDNLAEYHRKRARMAYERAIYYGAALLTATAEGFEGAQKNNDSIRLWLKNFTRQESATDLFWAGFAMLARIHLFQDEPAIVSDLFIPIAMLERSRELDPTAEHYSSSVALAAYHARSPMAEMDTARQMFDEALQKTQGKTLMVKTQYATEYACKKRDRGLYERLLNDVLAAEDPDPNQRLNNMIAKRKAARALRPAKMAECSFGAPQ